MSRASLLLAGAVAAIQELSDELQLPVLLTVMHPGQVDEDMIDLGRVFLPTCPVCETRHP